MASSAEPARNPVSGALLSAADVARVVDRMAHQLIERAAAAIPGRRTAASALVLVGIPTRGAPLARRLAARIEAFSGTTVDVGTADITLYRDDLRLRGVRALEPTVLPDGGHRRPARRPRRRRPLLRPLGPRGPGRAARPRPAARRAAGGAGRPRPPRAAHPRGLRRQERADLAHPAGEGPAGRDRRRRRGRRDGGGRSEAAPAGGGRPRPRRRDAGARHRGADRRRRWPAARSRSCPTLRGRTVVNLFYEDSTRTRISFELAAKRL